MIVWVYSKQILHKQNCKILIPMKKVLYGKLL